ncbi:MAG TPA: diguanylate cyclase, partial [Candidatus Acidoferrales bacterium]|nr:diguanylate cyclase [Candidatus Acidoferrales bacterium]
QDRAFHAQFAALTFRDSDRVRCRYRLRGLESEFTETSLREALYSALPPGEYTFEVACGSPDLGWTSSPATYSFTVLAPWWRSGWVVLAGLLTFALLVAAFTHLRTRRLESERKRLEAAVAERSAELAHANRELEEASLTDPLTGARNRRFFYSTIAADANQASRAYFSDIEGYSRDHRDLVFYLIDLDHFKDVNDAHGHDAGDEVLVHVAQRLARIVRQSDFLIRWGGEEFLVVCRAADRKDAAIFAERILAAVGREPFSISGGEKVTKTCSVGWAPFPWDPGVAMLSVDEVLKLADRGLYRAKELGRNQAVGMLPLEMAEVSVGVASGDGGPTAPGASTHEVVSSGPARS